MKKLVLMAALMISALAGFSQFGFQAGFNESAFRNGVEKDRGYKPGFTGGVYDRIYLGKVVSLQPELRYESKGTLINYDVPTREQFRLNMGYVTLPVLLNLHITKALAVSGGYYAGYLVHSNIGKSNYDNSIVNFKTSDFNKLDHGYVFGASVDLVGAIISVDASLGNRIVGKDGGPFGRQDVTPTYNHVYKNSSANLSLKVPVNIH